LVNKEKHQFGSIISGGRRIITAIVCCVTGYFLPLIIFKRKNSKVRLKNEALSGSIFAFNSESGYITKIFSIFGYNTL